MKTTSFQATSQNVLGGIRQQTHLWISLVLILSLAALTASAQTTTTVQFASGVTIPSGGIVLTGTGINPTTGQPFRHFWGGDETHGLCRYDPDLDSPGPYAQNINSCINFVGAVQFKPGELSFDPNTNNLYAPNIQAGADATYRIPFSPSGDSGHGILNGINIKVLVSSLKGKQAAGGCPTSLVAADSTALGPDGNLYASSLRSGAVVRIINPSANPFPCTNVQNDVIDSPDGRKNFGLGWIGHDLFGGDGFSAWEMQDADQCFTAANNFLTCTAQNILAGQLPVPTAMLSDQTFPNLNGLNLYYTNGSTVSRVQIVNGAVTDLNTSYATNFSLTKGLGVDAKNPQAEVLFVGDDPSAGNLPGSGHWWQVLPQGVPPALPGAPTNVTATAGNAQATVSWTAAPDGQTITSFTVHNSFASNGVLVPDVIVGPNPGTTVVPTSVVITGLTNGVTYQFEVAATDSVGTGPFSAPSNSVTPFAPTAPSAPTNVSATAGDTSAQVAWTASASNGGSAITGYTVTARVNGAPSGITASACATCTGANVTGLTNGTTYTFTVHATNGVGNSAESAPSNAVTPSISPTPPDASITDIGPASVNSGANATYTLKVSNSTNGTIPDALVSDTWPTTGGAALVSVTPSQGTCTSAAGNISCNLGAIAGSGSATVTLVLQLTAQTTNTATVSMKDAAGNPITDPTPADDTASATTSITAPQTTTDVQVTGSSANGGPAVGSADTFTWQIKNSGAQDANALSFTITMPPGETFASASTSVGSCIGPAAGTSGTITCTAPSLAAAATMIVTENVTVTQAGSLANTGTASFSGTDTNPANNGFTVTLNAK
ncbi:MAG TPA: fibronectin type III domain-containing protein [Candidatus Angelobacter sp.]